MGIVTTVFDCADPAARSAGLLAAQRALRSGDLVVFPTDTLYGLAANPFDATAVSALLAAKQRARTMPVPVLVGSWQTVNGLVSQLDPAAEELIHAFWPGAVSLVLPQAPSLAWDLGETRGTVMVRMPLHPIALELLQAVGPLAVSSANISGMPPAQMIGPAKEQLGDTVSVYLDAGEVGGGLASTIVDLTQYPPRIVRRGAVPDAAIFAVLGLPAEDSPADAVGSARSPRERES